MRDKLGVVAKRRGVVAKRGIVVTNVELLPSMVLLPSVAELGVVVTKRAPSGVALLPRLALSPELGIVVAERAPSCMALLPSGVALSLEHGVIVIVMFCGCWICK